MKENAGDSGLIPGSGKANGSGQLPSVFLLGKSVGRRKLVGLRSQKWTQLCDNHTHIHPLAGNASVTSAQAALGGKLSKVMTTSAVQAAALRVHFHVKLKQKTKYIFFKTHLTPNTPSKLDVFIS